MEEKRGSRKPLLALLIVGGLIIAESVAVYFMMN